MSRTEAKNLPVTEEAPHQKATSPYGNTKEINEQIIADYIHSGAAIKSIVLRYFNPMGHSPSAEIGELPNRVQTIRFHMLLRQLWVPARNSLSLVMIMILLMGPVSATTFML